MYRITFLGSYSNFLLIKVMPPYCSSKITNFSIISSFYNAVLFLLVIAIPAYFCTHTKSL